MQLWILSFLKKVFFKAKPEISEERQINRDEAIMRPDVAFFHYTNRTENGSDLSGLTCTYKGSSHQIFTEAHYVHLKSLMQIDCFDCYYNGFMLSTVAVQIVLDHYMHLISARNSICQFKYLLWFIILKLLGLAFALCGTKNHVCTY